MLGLALLLNNFVILSKNMKINSLIRYMFRAPPERGVPGTCTKSYERSLLAAKAKAQQRQSFGLLGNPLVNSYQRAAPIQKPLATALLI